MLQPLRLLLSQASLFLRLPPRLLFLLKTTTKKDEENETKHVPVSVYSMKEQRAASANAVSFDPTATATAMEGGRETATLPYPCEHARSS